MHELKPLPYPSDALEPFIDKETMELHHGKHHKTYVDKLNAALEKHPELFKKKIEELLKDLNNVPEDIRGAVRNHGGGHHNHSMWWGWLKKDTKAHGKLLEHINKDFGNFDKFKEQFTASALALFGSGWCWLVLNNGKLEILNLPNQDSPLSSGKIPVLGIDMWEHSAYLKYQNRKPEYIEACFHVFNWDFAEKLYENALKSKSFSV